MLNQLRACSKLFSGKKMADPSWDDKKRYLYFDTKSDSLKDHQGNNTEITVPSLDVVFNDDAEDVCWVEYKVPEFKFEDFVVGKDYKTNLFIDDCKEDYYISIEYTFWEEYIDWDWKVGDHFDYNCQNPGRYKIIFVNDEICLSKLEGGKDHMIIYRDSKQITFMRKL